MKFKKILALACCLAATGALLAGCGSNNTENKADTSAAVSEETSEESVEEETDTDTQEEVQSSDNKNSNHSEYAVIDPAAPLQENFLPDVIKNFSIGGNTTDEYKSRDIAAPGIDAVSLKGTWCKEGSESDIPMRATDVLTDAAFDLNEGAISQMTVLPDTLVLGLDDNSYLAESINKLSIYCGCRLGEFKYRDESGEAFFAVLPFKISSTSIGLGFYNGTDEDTAELIQEMDYTIDWTGYRLTLTYGDESVTYVPAMSIPNGENEGVISAGGKLVTGYQPVKDVIEVYPFATTPFVSFSDGTNQKAEFKFLDDGKCLFILEDGSILNFEYRSSGDTLTLIDGENVALYAN